MRLRSSLSCVTGPTGLMVAQASILLAACIGPPGTEDYNPLFEHRFIFETSFEYEQGDLLLFASPDDWPTFETAALLGEPFDAYEVKDVSTGGWTMIFQTPGGNSKEDEWEELCLAEPIRFEWAATRELLAEVDAGVCLENGGETVVSFSTPGDG